MCSTSLLIHDGTILWNNLMELLFDGTICFLYAMVCLIGPHQMERFFGNYMMETSCLTYGY